jgi:hypothetical protein
MSKSRLTDHVGLLTYLRRQLYRETDQRRRQRVKRWARWVQQSMRATPKVSA